MPKTPIKLVFFDLGNVLVHVHIERFYNAIAQLTNLSHDRVIALSKKNARTIINFNCGNLTPLEFYQIVCQEFNHISLEQFQTIYTNIFSLNNETVQLAKALKQQVRISIISNTDELHYNYISTQYPAIQTFETPVLSYKVKAIKPEPEIYYHALRQVDLSPAECIFIDDLSENIQAANNIGIKGIVYTSIQNLKNQLINYNLHI